MDHHVSGLVDEKRIITMEHLKNTYGLAMTTTNNLDGLSSSDEYVGENGWLW